MLPKDKRIQSKADLRDFLNKELSYYSVNTIEKFFMFSESSILRRHQLLLRKTEYL